MSGSIIKKAAGIGGSTLLSRFFAYIREILLMQFLGIGAVSDAFFIALRVPNSLRKAFAEGGLSSVLVPALVRAEKQDGMHGINKLLSLSFVMIEILMSCIVIALCLSADVIVYKMAPGASLYTLQKSVQFLKILAPFILLLSSSSVLSAALQATHRFLLPGLSPVILNCFYVIALCLGLTYSWSVEILCWSWMVVACINLIIHTLVCIHYSFRFMLPSKTTWSQFLDVMLQLLPCLLTVLIGEINFWIDAGFASYLQAGTLSLIRTSFQMVNIPLGVVATSLSIVLLPYFAKIKHSKEELGVYLSEAIKFVVWIIVPITFLMIYSSQQIFETMFLSSKFTMEHVFQAQACMNAYLVGLVFFALEKILLNAFYALQSSGIATTIAISTIALNFFMNRFLIGLYGGMGLALATSISAAVRIVALVIILAWYFKIDFRWHALLKTFQNYVIQMLFLGTIFYGLVIFISQHIQAWKGSYQIDLWLLHLTFNTHFFLHGFGFWVWFGLLSLLLFIGMYATRKIFGINLSYLD